MIIPAILPVRPMRLIYILALASTVLIAQA